jgi:hypothetical protein
MSPHGWWRADKVLISELAQLNQAVSLYVARLLDVDAGRKPALPVADEFTIAAHLVAAGEHLVERAAWREHAIRRHTERT